MFVSMNEIFLKCNLFKKIYTEAKHEHKKFLDLASALYYVTFCRTIKYDSSRPAKPNKLFIIRNLSHLYMAVRLGFR